MYEAREESFVECLQPWAPRALLPHHCLDGLETQMREFQSGYGAIFPALLQLAGAKADRQAVAELLETPRAVSE